MTKPKRHVRRSDDGADASPALSTERPPAPPSRKPRARRGGEAAAPAVDTDGVEPSPPAQEAKDVPTELVTDAPVVGDTSGQFESRLDERNLNRLPAVAGDAGAVGSFWLAAASTAGLSHLHAARTGQDSYSFAVSEDSSALVVSVADGLGSRPATSQVGAWLLSRAVCETVAGLTATDVAGEERESLVRARIDEASERACRRAAAWIPDVAEEALASTVAFARLPFERGTVALFGRVGDCGVFRLTGSEFDTLFEPDDHPLNVVGGSLPRPAVGDLLDLCFVDEALEAVVLATDGLTEDVFGSPRVREWLAAQWGAPCGVFKMIDSLRYRRRGSHDDRTALVVWADAAGTQPAPYEENPATDEGGSP